MTTTHYIPLLPGTAEALATIAHYESLEDSLGPDVDEAHRVWRCLIGPVGGIRAQDDLYKSLSQDLAVLWRLMIADWLPGDLDPLPDHPDFTGLRSDQYEAQQFLRTAPRLIEHIESRIRLARIRAAGHYVDEVAA